jgi:sodium-dependent dicarboxylate transporter 2/3/5
LATLIGSPPNALLAAYINETTSLKIGFAQWMVLGLPISLVLLAIAWWLLTRFLFAVRGQSLNGAATVIAEERSKLGAMNRGERIVLVIFVLTALSWVFRPALDRLVPMLHLSDEGIAITAAIVLFAFPVDLKHGEFALNWDWAKRLPWGVLILFGGGLSLASAISDSGLAEWIGSTLSAIGDAPLFVGILVVTIAIIFLTELTSNTATAAAFLPIVGGLAVHLGRDPLSFAIPAVLAASCAFMLPVATPPNAIVYGSGRISVPQMARAGIWMNLIATAVISVAAITLLPLVFG